MPKPAARPALCRAPHTNLTKAPAFCPVCVDGSLAILFDSELGSYACASCRRPEVRRMPRVDPHRGYQAPETSVAVVRHAIEAVREVIPKTTKQKRQAWKDGTFAMNNANEFPGILRRVKRRDDQNKPRTFDQAVAIAEKLPWYENSVYAGQSGGFYLWRERQAIP